MHRHTTHRARVRATAALAGTLLVAAVAPIGTGTTGANPSTEADVMAWLDAVSGAIAIDATAGCVSGSDPSSVGYRNDRVVVRTHTAAGTVAPQVDAILDGMYGPADHIEHVETITFRSPPAQPDIAPVLSVDLVPRVGGYDVLTVSRQMRTLHGEATSPDYAMTPSTPYTHYFPNGAPEPYAGQLVTRQIQTPPGAPFPGQDIGTGVTAFVFDTGLAPKLPGELPNVTRFQSVDDERPNADTSGEPKLVDYPAGGHGKAIGGVITTIAEGTTVREVRVNNRDGLLTDVDAARRISQTFWAINNLNALPDLLVMSFGTAVCDVTAGNGSAFLEPLGTQAVVEMVEQFDPVKPRGMLIVASAGNTASRRPHYPAAFEPVLSVGALDGTKDTDRSPWSSPGRTAPVADFSNVGDWVDAYAVGTELPTNHVAGGLQFQIDGPYVYGKAVVDGTSFAGPVVAGHLAELMSVTGLGARDARDALLASGVAPLPRCGGTKIEDGVAIVLASFSADIDDQPIGPAQPC